MTDVPEDDDQARVQGRPHTEGDSGKVLTLPDGSVSIPVFEERLVIEKRWVVAERIIVRKSTVVRDNVVEADLRRERVEILPDSDIEDRVHDPGGNGAG